MNPVSIILRAAITVYQWTLVPVLGANCRYEPSCFGFYATGAFRHARPARYGSWPCAAPHLPLSSLGRIGL